LEGRRSRYRKAVMEPKGGTLESGEKLYPWHFFCKKPTEQKGNAAKAVETAGYSQKNAKQFHQAMRSRFHRSRNKFGMTATPSG